MLSRMSVAIVLAMASVAVGSFDEHAVVAAPARKDLVLTGRISSITQGPDLLKPWIVTVDVEKVVSGEFSGDQFRFAIHSPARSGLEVGHSYTIKSVWKGQGYEVDEQQWRRGTKSPLAPH